MPGSGFSVTAPSRDPSARLDFSSLYLHLAMLRQAELSAVIAVFINSISISKFKMIHIKTMQVWINISSIKHKIFVIKLYESVFHNDAFRLATS